MYCFSTWTNPIRVAASPAEGILLRTQEREVGRRVRDGGREREREGGEKEAMTRETAH